MEYLQREWHGFRRYDFSFDGQKACLVEPKQALPEKKWLLKTEYFGAFPDFEIAMLERGYYLAHVSNITRMCLSEDTDRREAFCEFLHTEWGLAEQCLPVGMSCGGMQAVYFAARYPHRVAALYLDAPVMNLLSWPCAVGREYPSEPYEEFRRATGRTVSDLLCDRNQPIDHVDTLLVYRIPVALICGDADGDVPYGENGKILAEKYRQSDVPFLEVLKPGCAHHPHGLADPSPLIEFVRQFY